jgi:hypothetical protein
MKSSQLLFSSNKAILVKRFYHLDFYYFVALIIGRGFKTFDGIFKAIIQHQNDLYEISNILNSREKFKTENPIRATIDEMFRLGFVRKYEDESITLTKDGELLYNYILGRNFPEAEKLLCQKMENYFGLPSQLISYLRKANPNGGGLVVFPRPSPSALNISADEIIMGDKLIDYCKGCCHYAEKEIQKYMGVQINYDEMLTKLYNSLLGYFERMDYKKQSINIPREVKSICYSYYIEKFFENKFDATTFDIWRNRSRELKIINSSEQFPGFNGLILYPISVLSKTKIVKDEELMLMAETSENEMIYRYLPDWTKNKEMFVTSLWNNYIELSKTYKTFFIPILDLRDIVCFKLQISESTFSDFLSNAYNESMNEIIPHFKISLEVDRSPQERTFKNFKRLPILVNRVPKNIIGIKMN